LVILIELMTVTKEVKIINKPLKAVVTDNNHIVVVGRGVN
jgi:hypothetical protein